MALLSKASNVVQEKCILYDVTSFELLHLGIPRILTLARIRPRRVLRAARKRGRWTRMVSFVACKYTSRVKSALRRWCALLNGKKQKARAKGCYKGVNLRVESEIGNAISLESEINAKCLAMS